MIPYRKLRDPCRIKSQRPRHPFAVLGIRPDTVNRMAVLNVLRTRLNISCRVLDQKLLLILGKNPPEISARFGVYADVPP